MQRRELLKPISKKKDTLQLPTESGRRLMNRCNLKGKSSKQQDDDAVARLARTPVER
jgi:hypothetical protein